MSGLTRSVFSSPHERELLDPFIMFSATLTGVTQLSVNLFIYVLFVVGCVV